MRVSFASCIWPNDDYRWTKIFDEVPPCAGDCKDVSVGGHCAKDLERGVVLKEKVKLNADAADVLEHIAELHVFWVRTETVEAMIHIRLVTVLKEGRSLCKRDASIEGRMTRIRDTHIS